MKGGGGKKKKKFSGRKASNRGPEPGGKKVKAGHLHRATHLKRRKDGKSHLREKKNRSPVEGPKTTIGEGKRKS